MPENTPALTHDTIVQRIFELRGQRVMLDSDLAVLYGVETKALVRATKRNSARFEDFAFQLSYEEWDSLRYQIGTSNLRSQFVTSKSGRGGRRYAPYVFTEHGALMLSSVLKSERAEEISRMIIRAFVWMRQAVPAHKEIASKLAELESTVGKHDAAIGGLIETLNELMLPPDKEKRRIGF
ncbi:MAG: ORF6N domain-containing protein [Desulfovibrionaceae bacterium]|nr:ORF6N domain-containing protein [Desulfovibrionaceae bacterium]